MIASGLRRETCCTFRESTRSTDQLCHLVQEGRHKGQLYMTASLYHPVSFALHLALNRNRSNLPLLQFFGSLFLTIFPNCNRNPSASASASASCITLLCNLFASNLSLNFTSSSLPHCLAIIYVLVVLRSSLVLGVYIAHRRCIFVVLQAFLWRTSPHFFLLLTHVALQSACHFVSV